MKRRALVAIAAALALGAAAAMVPVGPSAAVSVPTATKATPMDLSAFSEAPPKRKTRPGASPDDKLRLLFIHHSCGGQMFAPPGPEGEEANCIYTAHPNGGDARRLLEAQGYEVHEASYGSEIGDKTDLFDWLPKFRAKGDRLLSVDRNDTMLNDGARNDVVVFKSCYPNSDFVAEGEAPGNPDGPELTYWNARATLTALLPELAKHPEVLYVYVTAPPRAPGVGKERAIKALAKKLLGKETAEAALARSAALARRFNAWVVAKDGWLASYAPKNVVAFDYYDTITGDGESNLSRYSPDGYDSHPTREGNARAAARLVPLVNRGVRRAGIAE